MFTIGFDIELTQFGVENPTSKISSFHIANEEKFNLLKNLMIRGYKDLKAHLIVISNNLSPSLSPPSRTSEMSAYFIFFNYWMGFKIFVSAYH
jgi:hypothetical protein